MLLVKVFNFFMSQNVKKKDSNVYLTELLWKYREIMNTSELSLVPAMPAEPGLNPHGFKWQVLSVNGCNLMPWEPGWTKAIFLIPISIFDAVPLAKQVLDKFC